MTGAGQGSDFDTGTPRRPDAFWRGTARATNDMNPNDTRDAARKGPLKPQADIGEVRVENPPKEPMLMSPEEADVSAIRLLDAAEKARTGLTDPDAIKG